MPTNKTARKRVRQTEKARLVNKAVRSLSKTNITKAEKLVSAGELEPAQKAVVESISSLDRAAGKGVIHANNAARRKSRLMKKLNQAKTKSLREPNPE